MNAGRRIHQEINEEVGWPPRTAKSNSPTVTRKELEAARDSTPEPVVAAECGSSSQACPCRSQSNASKAVGQGKYPSPPPWFPTSTSYWSSPARWHCHSGVALPGYWARPGTGSR